MLGNSNYVDITGQIEEVFDEKIQQIPIATTEYVEDRIKEITEAQGVFDPAILDDYALVGHTHSTINNNLNVSGSLNGYTIGTSDTSDNKGCIPTIDKTHGILDIGRFIDFHYPEKYPEAGDWCVRLQCDTGNKLALYGPSSTDGAHMSIHFNTAKDGTTIVKDNLQVDKNLTVNGDIKGVNINATDFHTRYAIYFKRDNILTDYGRIYMHGSGENGSLEIATSDDNTEPIYVRQYNSNSTTNPWTRVVNELTLLDASGNSSFPHDLNISGDLYVKGVKIDNLEIPSTINKSLTINGDLDITGDYMTAPGFMVNGEEFFVSRYINCESNGAYFGGDVKIEGDLTVNGVKIEGGGGTVEIPSTIDKDLTLAKNLTLNGKLIMKNYGIDWDQVGFTASGPCLLIHTEDYCNINGELRVSSGANITGTLKVSNDATLNKNLTVAGKLTVNGTEITGNQTILHKTDVISGEIGTFCETNGGIYKGYDKIDTTDCICQVQQSTTLNTKIVGIITSSDHFASHGDVLVKIVPGTYHLGDILCPDISGKARKATDTELQYMMLHAIPRPKITSLDTKIEGTVACFIV